MAEDPDPQVSKPMVLPEVQVRGTFMLDRDGEVWIDAYRFKLDAREPKDGVRDKAFLAACLQARETLNAEITKLMRRIHGS